MGMEITKVKRVFIFKRKPLMKSDKYKDTDKKKEM